MKPSGRREVLNEARRRVERALASDEAGDELAAAAEALLAGGGDAERERLIAAVKQYRRLRGEVGAAGSARLDGSSLTAYAAGMHQPL